MKSLEYYKNKANEYNFNHSDEVIEFLYNEFMDFEKTTKDIDYENLNCDCVNCTRPLADVGAQVL